MIIVYGKNSNDITILHKYDQLVKLGFTNVHIYTGGIFEWMLLHEIYGKDLFKITKYEIDILRYRPKSVLLAAMAGGGDISGYIEDTSGVGGSGTAENTDDFRIHIPDDCSGSSGGGSGGGGGGGGSILSTGIKWLFGS